VKRWRLLLKYGDSNWSISCVNQSAAKEKRVCEAVQICQYAY
jgi:hypothetical protein